jgi:ureidoacrylate peracid hydrolase
VADDVRLRLDVRRTALLVVDAQNDFCHQDGFFARSGFDVVPCSRAAERLSTVVPAARRRGVHVAWTLSTNVDPPTYRLAPLRFRKPRSSGRPLDQFVPGTWGWRIVDELEPSSDELVVEKPRYDAFLRTPLEAELRARGIDTVAIAGVITNCCVDTTARSAFMRGFDVLVLADCVGAFGQERDLHDAALRNLSLLFAVIADSDVFLDACRAGSAPVTSGPADGA